MDDSTTTGVVTTVAASSCSCKLLSNGAGGDASSSFVNVTVGRLLGDLAALLVVSFSCTDSDIV